jgi:hypothetical protein
MANFDELKQSAYEAGQQAAVSGLREILNVPEETTEAEVKTKIEELLAPHTPKERRKILKKLRHELNRKKRAFDAKRTVATQEVEHLDKMVAAFTEIDTWAANGDFVLERPTGSVLHQLRQDIIDGAALVFHKRDKFYYGQADDYEQEVFAESQIFLVEHNWAAAFDKAGDYEEGTEFHLPFEICVFEFNVCGHRVALIMTEMDGAIYHEIAAKTTVGWFLLGMATPFRKKVQEDGEVPGWSKLMNFLSPQVKAICVALEAEVAETEVTRAPHKLNRAREKMGRIALSDYHIISLAHRRRYPQLPSSPSDEPKAQKRLHFRRGHWRHFETFKAWVRWTLVGNPDLGFVDKDYRL